ncbi:hypothetical protein [Allochromatium vinosum]|uniref:hypothetical protein n=1 Tax=Allochromatium vinosum TaxID=1049 RepID=UPI0019051E9D|nr:hypothetical protein [Allochromatium vinosum]MBK1656130.1 hypothetical protein [Allochromatium vinosum]
MISSLATCSQATMNDGERSVPRRAFIGLLALTMSGCAIAPREPYPELSLTVTAPIQIPAGQAHAVLQSGRVVGTSNRLAPYCELEVRRVSGVEPQLITHGDFQVDRLRHSVLLDPTTRLPAFIFGSSCADPLYQESIWRLHSETPSEVLFLRCIAPYFHCTLGSPLTPAQVQQQVGRYLRVQTSDPAVLSHAPATTTPPPD